MHTHTFKTRFTFGDRVRFDSRLQQCSGEGTIEIITLDGNGHVDYMIKTQDFTEGGIQEDEMTLIEVGGVRPAATEGNQ